LGYPPACALIALTNQVAWEIDLLYGKKPASVADVFLSHGLSLDVGSRAHSRIEMVSPLDFQRGPIGSTKTDRCSLALLRPVVETKPEVRLIVGGEGPEAENLRSLARRLGIQDKVEFCGFIPDGNLPAQYLGAEVFAFPS